MYKSKKQILLFTNVLLVVTCYYNFNVYMYLHSVTFLFSIGKGVFVTKTYKTGEFLLQYPGELISWREGQDREKTYEKKGHAGSFQFFFQCKGKFYW